MPDAFEWVSEVPGAFNWIKDILVPLCAAVVGGLLGAGGALLAALYPLRKQQRFEEAQATYAIAELFSKAKLASATILANEPLGALEGVLRSRIESFIRMLPKLAIRIDRVLVGDVGRDRFHLM